MDEKRMNAVLAALSAQRNAALDQLALADGEIQNLREQVKQMEEELAKLAPSQAPEP